MKLLKRGKILPMKKKDRVNNKKLRNRELRRKLF